MISDQIKIRDAKPEDAIAISLVHQKAIHEIAKKDYPENILEAWHSLDKEIHQGKCKALENKINKKATEIIVAEYEDEIIGFGELELKNNTIVAVYIHPKIKRNGIGTLLLNKLEEIAKYNGLESLTLDGSLTAENFYSTNGFEIIEYGAHRLRTGDLMKCVKMKKEIG